MNRNMLLCHRLIGLIGEIIITYGRLAIYLFTRTMEMQASSVSICHSFSYIEPEKTMTFP